MTIYPAFNALARPRQTLLPLYNIKSNLYPPYELLRSATREQSEPRDRNETSNSIRHSREKNAQYIFHRSDN